MTVAGLLLIPPNEILPNFLLALEWRKVVLYSRNGIIHSNENKLQLYTKMNLTTF